MELAIPARVAATCAATPAGAAWLRRAPVVVAELERRWSLRLAPAFDGDEVSCALVMPAARADGSPAVLKLGMPHFEAEHEIRGLHEWDGDPTVRLLESDEAIGAMLLERCQPGTHLRWDPLESTCRHASLSIL